jgi:2-polyprenyl-3-methyl-5-hydroxy-6-metoxy-1,4-benzoquinol methylase
MTKPKINVQAKIDPKEWADSQNAELDFHKDNNWRADHESFTKSNISFFENVIGYNNTDYAGKNILDLGAGSKLRAKFFKDANIHVIEPLANKFMNEIEWCDLNDAVNVYSVPAEELVTDIIGKMDMVMSINVIDHCYNFTDILDNIHKYMSDDGIALLSFDMHAKVDKMHPIILTDEFASQKFKEHGFIIQKKQQIEPYHRGISKAAMTYWLNKK